MSKAAELAALIGSQSALSNRNIIINGAAEIYQRGAATTTHNGYAVDRWQHKGSNSTTSTSNQDTDAPAPFINSIKFSAGGASSGAAEVAGLCQRIEGNAMTSLGWGTSAAQPATLSFYVKSSVTGTYAVSARNNGVDQSYINTYTISSANTWEYKTVTFDARTTGTWLTTNGIGMRLWFDLGSGSNFDGTAGSWTTNNHLTVSSQADVVGTSSATWFVTGVQLEVGEQDTAFEHRSFGDELLACMRYYQQIGGELSNTLCTGQCTSSTLAQFFIPFIVPVRDDPTCSVSDQTHFRVFNAAVSGIPDTTNMTIAATNAASHGGFRIITTVGSGLVAGNATMLSGSDSDSNAGIIKMDAEL